ncbi:MAG: gliding motility lipoprotein GldD [Bacteroidota bacterium]|nr:gliding motility lipoprotein GldD [Bacteroidota bacterium]
MKKLLIILVFIIASCNGDVSTPKPHAYPRFYFPEKQYQIFDSVAPFSFLYPTYAMIQNHQNEDTNWNPYWYNIHYIPFNATLHLSYLSFKNRDEFNDLFNDTRKLVYKHDIRAEEIQETEIINQSADITGIVYELKGNTATNLNFYISDGKQHFLRGALYFNAKTEIDSIQPAFDFLKTDIIKLIETTKWRNP